MKLLLPVVALTVGAILVILFWPTGTGQDGVASPGFHTEVVPADPLVEVAAVGEVEPSEVKLGGDSREIEELFEDSRQVPEPEKQK